MSGFSGVLVRLQTLEAKTWVQILALPLISLLQVA